MNGAHRRRFSLLLALVVAGGVGAGAHGTAAGRPAEPVEQVTALVFGSEVEGVGPASTTISASLRAPGPGGALRGTGTTVSDVSGRFGLTLRGGATADVVRMMPGDRLLVALGMARTLDLVLPELVATPDAAADSVAGGAPPGAMVVVTVDDPIGGPLGTTVNTTADDKGHFVAQFVGQLDLVAGSLGHIDVPLSGGGIARLRWAVPTVRFTLGEPTVAGSAADGQPVSVVLKHGSEVVASISGTVGAGAAGGAAWSATLQDRRGRPVPIMTGDIVTLAIGAWQLDVELPVLVIRVNHVTGLAAGQTTPGATVHLMRTREPDRAPVSAVADGSGRFQADLAGDTPLNAGEPVTVDVALSDGVHLAQALLVPGLDLVLDTGRLSGYAAPGATVSAALVDTGGRVVATGVIAAGDDGAYDLQLRDDQGTLVHPINTETLRVDSGGRHEEMAVPLLTVSVDAVADKISGQAPSGGTVTVTAHSLYDQRGVTAKSSVVSGGLWGFDLAGQTDIGAGTHLDVAFLSPDGHMARRQPTLPILHVQRAGSVVSGYSQADTLTGIAVRRAGVAIATSAVHAALDGAFRVYLTDEIGRPLVLLPDDIVTAGWTVDPTLGSTAEGTLNTSVLDVRAGLDASSRAMHGHAPAGAEVLIVAGQSTTGPAPWVQHLTTDSGGDFNGTVDGTGSLPAGFDVEAGVLDETGSRTYYLAVVPYLEVLLGSNEVHGRVGSAEAVTLTLQESLGDVGLGMTRSDTNGGFGATLHTADGAAATLSTGRTLRLQHGDATPLDLVLPPLSVVLWPDEHRLAGTAPPGAQLVVHLTVPGLPRPALATMAGLDGQWRLTDSDVPPGAPYTLADVRDAEVAVSVDNGHLVLARAAMPKPTPTASPTPTVTATSPATTPPTATPKATPSATVSNPKWRVFLPYARQH